MIIITTISVMASYKKIKKSIERLKDKIIVTVEPLLLAFVPVQNYQGHNYNQDTLICPNGAHNREVLMLLSVSIPIEYTIMNSYTIWNHSTIIICLV